MTTHTFKAGQAVKFKDRHTSGSGTIAEVKHTTKGDFIVITLPGSTGTRSVRPVNVTAA